MAGLARGGGRVDWYRTRVASRAATRGRWCALVSLSGAVWGGYVVGGVPWMVVGLGSSTMDLLSSIQGCALDVVERME